MGLLDDVGRAITDKSNDALGKAKERADISKFNSLIGSEQAAINNNYFQVGKLYSQLHADDCEDCFKVYIEAISQSQIKIAEYEKNIKSLKGIADCPNCGAEVPFSAAFCNVCGKPMPNAPQIDLTKNTKCPNCGTYVPNNMKFCVKCGMPMPVKAPQPQQPVYQQPVQQPFGAPQNFNGAPIQNTPVQNPAPVAQHSNRCTTCGSVLEPDSAFCPECGTRV